MVPVEPFQLSIHGSWRTSVLHSFSMYPDSLEHCVQPRMLAEPQRCEAFNVLALSFASQRPSKPILRSDFFITAAKLSVPWSPPTTVTLLCFSSSMGLAEEEERMELPCFNACRAFLGRCRLLRVTVGVYSLCPESADQLNLVFG